MCTDLRFIPFDSTNALCGEELIKRGIQKNLHSENIEDLVNFVEPTFNRFSRTNDKVNVVRHNKEGITLEYMNWYFKFDFDGKFTWYPTRYYDSRK